MTATATKVLPRDSMRRLRAERKAWAKCLFCEKPATDGAVCFGHWLLRQERYKTKGY